MQHETEFWGSYRKGSRQAKLQRKSDRHHVATSHTTWDGLVRESQNIRSAQAYKNESEIIVTS